jgi:hypothetical protein
MAKAIIKTVQLKEAIKDPKYRSYSDLKRLDAERHSIELKIKDRVIIFDDRVIIPLENVVYMTFFEDPNGKE